TLASLSWLNVKLIDGGSSVKYDGTNTNHFADVDGIRISTIELYCVNLSFIRPFYNEHNVLINELNELLDTHNVAKEIADSGLNFIGELTAKITTGTNNTNVWQIEHT